MYSSQTKKFVDYQVEFVDCQRLERLLENLSLSQEILKAIEYTLYVLPNADDYTELFNLEQNPRDLYRMTRQINQVRGFIRTATALQYRAERTTILVSLPGLVYKASF